MSSVTELWDRLDDGTHTQDELVALIGVDWSYITNLRRDWVRRQARRDAEGDRCVRCKFFFEELVPHKEDGLCLWCWLDREGIDHSKFYESGEWLKHVSWRPGSTSGTEFVATLQGAVRRKASKARRRYSDIAREIDCSQNSLRVFLNRNDQKRVFASTMQWICRYLGIEPINAKAVGEHFGIHHRKVSH